MIDIYKITNNINGKIYIGQSKRVKRRIVEHINDVRWKKSKRNSNSQSLISKAIQKYGIENFTFEIIEDSLERMSANKLESDYIKKFNSLVPNGYNLRLYSEDNRNEVHYSTKNKLSKIGQGVRHASFDIKKLSSKYIGVCKVPNSEKYRMFVRVSNKIKSKVFENEILAAETYDKIMIFIHGESAKLNFPEKLNSYLLEDLKSIYNNFVNKIKKSKFIGVGYVKRDNKWCIKLPSSFKCPFSLPYFDSEEEAATVRDKIIIAFELKIKKNFDDSENHCNVEDLNNILSLKTTTSKFKGVSLSKRNNKWRSYYYLNGKQITVGEFDSEIEAAKSVEGFYLQTSIPAIKESLF